MNSETIQTFFCRITAKCVNILVLVQRFIQILYFVFRSFSPSIGGAQLPTPDSSSKLS